MRGFDVCFEGASESVEVGIEALGEFGVVWFGLCHGDAEEAAIAFIGGVVFPEFVEDTLEVFEGCVSVIGESITDLFDDGVG